MICLNGHVNLIKCAHKIYCEYQLALRDGKKCLKWGKYGIFFLDSYCKTAPQISNMKNFMLDPQLSIILFCSNNPFAKQESGKNVSNINTQTDVNPMFNNLTESDNTISQSNNNKWPGNNKNMYYIF